MQTISLKVWRFKKIRSASAQTCKECVSDYKLLIQWGLSFIVAASTFQLKRFMSQQPPRIKLKFTFCENDVVTMSESKIAIARICGEKQWWGFHGHFYFFRSLLGLGRNPILFIYNYFIYLSIYIYTGELKSSPLLAAVLKPWNLGLWA